MDLGLGEQSVAARAAPVLVSALVGTAPGAGFRIEGLLFRVWGSEFQVSGIGLGFSVVEFWRGVTP